MITFNLDLFVTITIIITLIVSVAKILGGIILYGDEKPNKYGIGDVVSGFLWLIIIIVVMLT